MGGRALSVAIVLAACFVASAVAVATESEAALNAEIDAELDNAVSVWGAKSKCASLVIPGVNYEKEFARFCKRWGKTYKLETVSKRFRLFKKSFNCVTARNARLAQRRAPGSPKRKGSRHYRLGLNYMSDHTAKEFTVKLGHRSSSPNAPAPTVGTTERDWDDDGEGIQYPELDAAALQAAAASTSAGTTGSAVSMDDLNAALTQAERETQELLSGLEGAKRDVKQNSRRIKELQRRHNKDLARVHQKIVFPGDTPSAALLEVGVEMGIDYGTLDWRTAGAVTTVTDQGQCGDCWSHAATNVAEGAWQRAGNFLQKLSQQQVVDCAVGAYNNGCNGGNSGTALQLMQTAGGFASNAAYPFVGNQMSCYAAAPTAQLSTVNLGSALYPTGQVEDQLQEMLQNGPVAVSINGEAPSFQSYTSGVYDDASCNSVTVPNHAVTAIGYGTDPTTGIPYWTIKNSWGTGWGEHGFIRIRRGVNRCLIASEWVGATSAPAATWGLPNVAPAVNPGEGPNGPVVAPVNPNQPPKTGAVCRARTSRGKVVRGHCMAGSSCRDLGRFSYGKAGLCTGPSNVKCCLSGVTAKNFAKSKKSKKSKKTAKKKAAHNRVKALLRSAAPPKPNGQRKGKGGNKAGRRNKSGRRNRSRRNRRNRRH